jgi:hypothetical protein
VFLCLVIVGMCLGLSRATRGVLGPVGEVGANGLRDRMFRAENPLAYRQQRGELVTSPSRIPPPPQQKAIG